MAIGTNPAGGTLSGTKTLTVSSGVANFTGLNIDKAGTGYTLSATSSPSYTSSNSSGFNITAASANATNSTLTPATASMTANGTSTQAVTVTAKDAFGNTLTTGGSTVTITKSSGNGTIGAVTDNGNGTYTATVTSPTTTGNGVFIATLGAQPVKSGTGSQTTATITYTPGAADATQSTLTPTTASITANGSSTQILTVTAKDAFGNLITSGGSTVTIVKSSGNGTIGSVTDNGNGTYTATVTSPTATGNGVFIATLGGNPVKSGTGSQTTATITYTTGPADATQSTLTPTTASITANGSSTQVLTVTAKDAFGNLLTTGGSTVTITKSSGNGTIGSVTDNSNGTYTATVTSPTTTGNGVFIATLGAQPVKSGTGSQTTATITYTPGAADATQSALTPTSASIIANGSSTQILTVTAKDAYGNLLTTGGSTITITKSSGNGTIGSVTDNGNGTYTATVTSPTTTGNGVFIATLGGNPVKSGTGSQTTATITYVPGAADATQSTLTPTSASITANGSSTQVLTVTVKDAFGNLLTTGGSTVTMAKSSGNGTIGSVTDNGNGTYTATVTSPTTTGNGVFIATLGGNPVKSGTGSQTSATITYTPGTADATQSTLTPTTSSVTANGTSTQILTVTAKDTNGNALTTGGSVVTITKSSGTGSIGTVTDNGNGTYTATVTAPTATGSGVFVATLGGNPVKSGSGSQTLATVTYTAGALDHFAISTISSPQTAGTAITGITLTAQDFYNNTVTSFTSNVSYSGTAGITGTSSNFTSGQLTGVSVTPTVSGTSMTFIVTGSTKTGTATFNVNPAALDHFAISTISSPQTAGTAITGITLTAKDIYNNTVTSFASTVTYSGTAGITGTSATFTSGQLTGVSVTPTVAGTGMTFIVTGSTKTGTASFDVNPGAANATNSTLTPTSASITANGSSTQILTVTAKDAYGNLLTTGGSTVTITKSSGNGTIGSVTDNGNGTYTATVTSPTATGSGIFIATLGGNPVKSGTGSQTTATITFTPGAADATQSTLTPTSASITANGSSTQVLTVTAKDANGNLLSTGGATVTITKQSGTGMIGSVTDNGNGTYTATVTSPTATGSGVFAATLGGNPVKSGTGSQTTATITYTPGAADATQSTLTPTSASITSDGTSTQVLSVTAKDAFGNLITSGGATVSITKSSGNGTIGSVTDNGNGTYTATVTAPTATGSGVFVATLGGNPVKSGGGSQTQVTVNYVPGAANATQSTLTPTSASITSNGSSIQILTVTAKDSFGNLLTTGGSTVTITKSSGNGTIGSVTDNGNGTYTATVTSPTSTGNGVFIATLGGQPVKSGTGSQTTATVTYTTGASDATQSTLTPASSNITANGTSTQVLTVTAKDAFGNLLTTGGATVTITKSSGTGSISTVTDNGNGTYTATVTSSTSTGSGIFVATLGGNPVKSGTGSQTQATVNYTTGTADATQSTLTPTGATISADGTSTQVLTVTAKDALGNLITSGGATVTITKSSGNGTIGSVTDNSNGTYTATVTAPVSGGNGVFIATLGGNPVKSGTGSQTQATITYQTLNFTITASAGTGGTISPSGNVTVNYLNSQAFNITPNTGYSISSVLVDSVSQGAITSYTFTSVSANHTISASFTLNTFTLTYNAGANGSISGNATQTVDYNAGGTAVTAVPNTGYHFVNWSDASITNPRTDTNVTANISVTASFAINTYTLTYAAGANGSVTGNTTQTVNYNGSGTAVTAVPASGYHFVQWSDSSATNPRTDTSVTANISVTASFAANGAHTITASSNAGGTITPSGAVSVSDAQDQSFTISPNVGHFLYDVSVDGVSQGAITDYTFMNVTTDHTITATFDTITYIITASAGSGGSISPSGSVAVNQSDNQTFNITANGGNSISDVLVDGLSVGAVTSYTFTNVTGTHTISASFNVITHAITATGDTGGTITPSGTVLVNDGDSQTFHFAASSGYYIGDVVVDGVSQGAVTSYTFTNVNGNHNMYITFYTTSVGSSSGSTSVPAGVPNYVVDASSTAQATITVNATAPVTINVIQYTGNPHPEAPLPANSVPKYDDIVVSDHNAITWPLHVEIHYTDADVSSLVESSLKMYYFQGNSWHVCSSTGVDTVNNIVWANMTSAEVLGSPLTLGGDPLGGGGETVGGNVYQVNKLLVLLPWMSILAAILITGGGTSYLIFKRRRIK